MSFPEKNSHLVVCLLMSAVLIAGMLLSCKNRHPDDVLPKAKMEAILFDYHLALSLAEADADSSEIKGLAYTDFVLKKHGITQSDVDHSATQTNSMKSTTNFLLALTLLRAK